MNFQRLDEEPIELANVSNASEPIIPESGERSPGEHPSGHHLGTYRPDIDGLRTVAILLVIIYHAWPKSLPGGFIGVDIFFVISGYLITQIIIKETLKNTFTSTDFYSRRVKRIFPALLIVLTFTLLVAAKYSQKDQAKSTFNTLDASVIFGANLQVLFYDKGYFDPDIRLNPLLHLWSLGVEEQFYIFWPCLILIVFRSCKSKIMLALGLFAALSFITAIISVFIDSSFAFYFPICRFWQMAVGGILAKLKPKIHSKLINNLLSTISLLAILITVFIISDKSLFPGFWALVPTLSAACIIQAKNEAFINKQILSSKLFIAIGKISYSLYLWHWPLLVFGKTFFPPGSTSIFANTFFIVFLTFVLTIITYFIAEDPIRKMRGQRVVWVLLGLMVLVGVSTVVININVLPQLEAQKEIYTVRLIEQAEKQMMPRVQEDYVKKNGKKIPNLSKSKKRQGTTAEKVRLPKIQEAHDYAHGRERVLDKEIDESSKFFKKDRPEMDYYAVANQGGQNKNLILLVGDSHSLKLQYRFHQLYMDAVNSNKTEEFPTIVAMVKYSGDPTKFFKDLMDYVIRFTKEFKPSKIMFINHWLNRFCPNGVLPLTEPASYDMKRLYDYTQYYLGYVKQLQQLNVEVFMNTVDIEMRVLNPLNMVDFNGVIEENIQPFRLSTFTNRYREVIDAFNKWTREAKVKTFELTDHLCWEDECHVLSPSGHGVYVDDNHYGKYYVRHWLTSVDELVK